MDTRPTRIVVFLAIHSCVLLSLADARAADAILPAVTLTGHKTIVNAVTFSYDGRRLASLSDDGVVKVWDVADHKEIASFEGAQQDVRDIRFTTDASAVVVLGRDNDVLLMDVAAGKPRKPIPLAPASSARAFALAPDGKRLVVAFRGKVCVYLLSTGELQSEFEAHKGYSASAVAFSPDGKSIATAGSDNKALLINAASGETSQSFDLQAKGELIAFAADGKQIFVVSDDRKVRSFSVDGGEGKTRLDRGVHVLTVNPSGDGRSLILGGYRDGPAILDLATDEFDDRKFASEDRIMATAISPDGKWLAGGGHEGGVYLWGPEPRIGNQAGSK